MKYCSVYRILLSVNRELGDIPFSETDLVEWIGEAMEFLNVLPILEESVKFLKVKDNKATLPKGLVHILQLAKLEKEIVLTQFLERNIKTVDRDPCETDYKLDCTDNSFIWEYRSWIKSDIRTSGFSPIRLSNHSFFKSLVCKENDYDKLYHSCDHEYSILKGESPELLFSFKDGIVALSYVRLLTDSETGYPLVPDQADFISAVQYYLKWKISEAMTWRGKEGYQQLLQYARGEWLRYAKQAKNWAKMPKSVDEWQNLMEQQYNMIPDIKAYYKGFSDLTKRQHYEPKHH